MKKAAHFILYLLFLFFIGLFAILPFRVIYVISDGLRFLLFYVIGYRKKVVYSNLRRSFPEKDEAEIHRIAKRFYNHLADVLVESIKGFAMTRKQVYNRHHLINPEVVQEYINHGQSVIGVVAHYNNWEWGSMSGSVNLDADVMILYKPLSNPFIDRFLTNIRKSFGTELVSIFRTYKGFKERQNKPYLYVLAADQSPSKVRKAYWVDFLNQDTACLHGPEKYARLYNYPVFYLNIQKVKRGYYTVSGELLTERPADLPDGEVTRLYMKRLEQSIKQAPEYWLWSHRRWKKKHSKQPENSPQ